MEYTGWRQNDFNVCAYRGAKEPHGDGRAVRCVLDLSWDVGTCHH